MRKAHPTNSSYFCLLIFAFCLLILSSILEASPSPILRFPDSPIPFSAVLGNHIVRKALHRRGDIAVA